MKTVFFSGSVATILICAFFSFNSFSQSAKSTETATIKIKTSAQCGSCKEKIENALKAEKGVVSATLDLTTKIVTVVYKTVKTNPDALRNAIAKVGYDADNIPANTSAYNKLPACCKKP